MKLCDVTQFYSPFSGGVKRYLHEKIAYLQDSTAHEHVLIVPGAKTECIKEQRSRVYAIKSPIASRTTRYRILLNLRALETILERERPDLIESSDPYQIGWKTRTVGQAMRIPVIGFYHSHFAEAHVRGAARMFGAKAGETLTQFAQRYVRKLYNSFAATLVPSEPLGEILRGWGVKNVRAVKLGVDTHTFTPLPEDAGETRAQLGIAPSGLLLYVGRLSKEKNTRTLFRAFQLLHTHAPAKFHLLVIGDGPERRQLVNLKEQCGHVTWLRYCAEPVELARYYRAADLFVHPGTQETFGLVALESQACGTPLIGIRGSFMDDVIRHDQSWWSEEETAESLANAIERGSHCDLGEIGRNAAIRVAAEFAWPRVFERLFYIYEEVCSKYNHHGST